ncbi:asparagine synthase (glutamine-hydrolyzing) [Nonomuraea antimicrobica]|uniref:asparagine synthase (glutamine-hydrolyzing) n=1 Tax=Nonomuraea antimicrobica TaxID=561173 RepID=A0ABP7DF95_9ACTN
MSGVVGWIDYSRNLALERPLMSVLTGNLAQRGPDGEAVWVSPHAAIGYRELSFGDDGRPFQLEPGPVTVCVVGSPYNLGELRHRLPSAPAPEASASEVVARAYLEWGTEFVPWLDGPFAIVIWDGRTRELVLARDRIGGQPLFHTATPTGVLFASRRETLLEHPEVAPVVDVGGLRQVISHALPTGPIFAGFESVGPAEIVTFDADGRARRERYWSLTTQEHTHDLDATVATIRELLEESIRLNIPEDPAQLVAMLSGGIDSSSVAALAAAELRRRGLGPLRTFTIDYLDSEFQADVMRRTKDEPYARKAASHIGAAHTVVTLRPADILHPLVQQGLLAATEAPARIYDMDAGQHIFLRQAAAQNGKIILTGFGGDNAFLGSNWAIDRGLVESGTFPWLALAQRHGAANGFGTGLLSKEALDVLDFPVYYRDTYATAIANVVHLPGEDAWQRALRRVSYLVMTLFRTDYAMFTAAGLQARSPINGHRLLEYAFNIPADLQAHGGIEKGLLRAAVKDLLPEEIIQRRRSATPVGNNPDYPRQLQVELKEILADTEAPVRPLLDLDLAAARAGDPAILAENRLARADVEMMIQINNWLTRYRVRLALQ